MRHYKIYIFILLIVFFYWWHLDNANSIKELRESGSITNALVTKWRYVYKQGMLISYQFKVDDKTYNSQTKLDSPYCDENLKYLPMLKVPLLYSKRNPNINILLLEKKTYDFYNLKYPDSFKKMCDSLHIFNCI